MSKMSTKLCSESSDCVKSGSEMRQSFERFGDDLSELILSYLLLDECFKHECVSKQWQRLIFNKQADLNLMAVLDQLIRHMNDEKALLNKFEFIVRKLPNITSIVMHFTDISKSPPVCYKTGFKLMAIVLKQCKPVLRLKAYTMPNGLFLRYSILRHLDKFGNNTTMSVNAYEKQFKAVLESCPVLEELHIKSMDNISVVFRGNQILVTNLKKICFVYNRDDKNRFEMFVENNKNTLKSLIMKSKMRLNSDDLKPLLEGLPKLSKLKTLSLDISENIHDSDVIYLKQMAIECKNLKKIVFQFLPTNDKTFVEILKLMKNFKHLKRFSFLALNEDYDDCEDEDKWLQIDCSSLKDCKQLTHLELQYFSVNENIFDCIDKHLPQLQEIYIQCNDFSEQTLSPLSRLRYIRDIDISAKSKTQISEPFIMNLIDSCPHIQYISLTDNRFESKLYSGDIFKIRTKGLVESGVKIMDIYESDESSSDSASDEDED